jgi:ABC-type Fe3+-hydroxamate transport system substrate-binding protein
MTNVCDQARRDAMDVVHPRAAGEARIVCLVPSLTELLFTMGLDANVVGRTGFCIHPRDAVRCVPKIGGTKDVDLAKVRALAPTHLVVNVDENRRETVDALRQVVPNVIVTHPLQPDDNPKLYSLFGAIFGREAEAAALAARFAAAKNALLAAVDGLSRERVLYVIWRDPWYTVARSTYVSATLALAGWDTVPENATSRYPTLGADDPAWQDADRILLSTEPYAFRDRDRTAIEQELKRRTDRTVPVALIDGEMTSWYGSRAIAGLAYLGRIRQTLAGC